MRIAAAVAAHSDTASAPRARWLITRAPSHSATVHSAISSASGLTRRGHERGSSAAARRRAAQPSCGRRRRPKVSPASSQRCDRRHQEEHHAEHPDRVQPPERGPAMIDAGTRPPRRGSRAGDFWWRCSGPSRCSGGEGERRARAPDRRVIGSPPVRRGRSRPEGPPAGADGAVGSDDVARDLGCAGGVGDREVLRQALGVAEMGELIGLLPRGHDQRPGQANADDDDEQGSEAFRRRETPEADPLRRRCLGGAQHGSAG